MHSPCGVHLNRPWARTHLLGIANRCVDPPSLIKAVEAARSSDVAIVFAGTWAHEGFDASTLALLLSQNQLIEAVAAANPRTIVVLQSGTPILMPWLSKVASVLEVWFPRRRRLRRHCRHSVRRRQSFCKTSSHLPHERRPGPGPFGESVSRHQQYRTLHRRT